MCLELHMIMSLRYNYVFKTTHDYDFKAFRTTYKYINS